MWMVIHGVSCGLVFLEIQRGQSNQWGGLESPGVFSFALVYNCGLSVDLIEEKVGAGGEEKR